MTELPSETPNNLMEWLWRLKRYEHCIFVRAKNNDGKWDSVPLTELTPKEWATHVAGWIEDGRIPVRIKEPSELTK